jgi:hypothetical protein
MTTLDIDPDEASTMLDRLDRWYDTTRTAGGDVAPGEPTNTAASRRRRGQPAPSITT